MPACLSRVVVCAKRRSQTCLCLRRLVFAQARKVDLTCMLNACLVIIIALHMCYSLTYKIRLYLRERERSATRSFAVPLPGRKGRGGEGCRDRYPRRAGARSNHRPTTGCAPQSAMHAVTADSWGCVCFSSGSADTPSLLRGTTRALRGRPWMRACPKSSN